MTATLMHFLVPREVASQLTRRPDILRSIVYVIDEQPAPAGVRKFFLDRLWGELSVVMTGLRWHAVLRLLQGRLKRRPDPEGNQYILELSAASLARLQQTLQATSLQGARERLEGVELLNEDNEVLEGEWLSALLEPLGEWQTWLVQEYREGDVLLIVTDA